MVTNILKSHSIERKLFLGAITLCVFSALAYAAVLGGAINHAMTRRKTGEEIAVLRARVALLESTYFARTNGIDTSVAADLGFIEARSVAYIARTQRTPALSLNVQP